MNNPTAINTIDELKSFAERPMPAEGSAGDFKNAEEMRRLQRLLPDEILISKEVGSFLVTHHVDAEMRREEAQKVYKPGLSVGQFAASTVYSFITGHFGVHNLQSAYTMYQSISNYKRASGEVEPVTQKILGSYRIEKRTGNRLYLAHGKIHSQDGYRGTGHMTMTNVGFGYDPKNVPVAELYDAVWLGGGTPDKGRSH